MPKLPVRKKNIPPKERVAFWVFVVAGVTLIIIGWFVTVRPVIFSGFRQSAQEAQQTYKNVQTKFEILSPEVDEVTNKGDTFSTFFEESIELKETKDSLSEEVIENMKAQIEAQSEPTYAEEETK